MLDEKRGYGELLEVQREARPSPFIRLVFGLIFSRHCLFRFFEPVSVLRL